MNKSIKEDDRPSFPFFVKDWLTDTGLALCGPIEKGIWIDMLCYMFTSPVRGAMLNPDGSIMDRKTMARLLRVDEKCLKNALGKLMANGVARKLENGMIVNWRMYAKDKDLSQKRREAGMKGAVAKWDKNNEGESMASGMASGMANLGKDGLPEKEKQKHKYLDLVYLSIEEFKKLEERFGKEMVDQMIERLNNYIGSTGKKYHSHYHTILTWAQMDRKREMAGTHHTQAHKPWEQLRRARIALERKGGYDAIVAQLRELPESVWGELKKWYTNYYHDSSTARSFSRAQDTVYAEREAKKRELTQTIERIGAGK